LNVGLEAVVSFGRRHDHIADFVVTPANSERTGAITAIRRCRMADARLDGRWDPRCAHLLLQVRVRVVDGQLRDDFARWYPGLPSNASTMSWAA
jgi:hypothetical protein